MGMVESRRPWKSMMLMGESGAGLYPRSGALHTVPALATLPASLSITRVQMNIPPLDIPGSVLELATNLREVFTVSREGPYYGLLLVERTL